MEHVDNNHDCLSDLSALETSLNSHIGEPLVLLTDDDLIDSAICLTGTNLGFSGDERAPLHAYNHDYETERSYSLDDGERALIGIDDIWAYAETHMGNYIEQGSMRSLLMAMWVANRFPEIFGPQDDGLLNEAKSFLRSNFVSHRDAYGIVEALLSMPDTVRTPLVTIIEERFRDAVLKNGIAAIIDDGLIGGYITYVRDSTGDDASVITRILSR